MRELKTSHDIRRRASADADEVFWRKFDLKADFSSRQEQQNFKF